VGGLPRCRTHDAIGFFCPSCVAIASTVVAVGEAGEQVGFAF